MSKKTSLFVLFIITLFASCQSEDNNTLDAEISNNQIPEWVKEKVSSEELKIIDSLIKDHKIIFTKLKKRDYSSPSLIDVFSGRDLSILSYPRQKSYGEGTGNGGWPGDGSGWPGSGWPGGGSGGGSGWPGGGSGGGDLVESLGRREIVIYSGQIANIALITAKAYFGYSYDKTGIKEICSLDIDVKANIPNYIPYWVPLGSSREIVNRRIIRYSIRGEIRYKLTVGGDIGMEIWLATVNKDGAFTPPLN